MSPAAPAGGSPAADAQLEYVLTLYVIAGSPASRRAISNLRAVCEQRLDGRYTLEVIDLRERPALARERSIIAAPTFVRERPPPERRLIGDLSDLEPLLLALDLDARGS